MGTLLTPKGSQKPTLTFRPMSIVAKRLSISATAQLLLIWGTGMGPTHDRKTTDDGMQSIMRPAIYTKDFIIIVRYLPRYHDAQYAAWKSHAVLHSIGPSRLAESGARRAGPFSCSTGSASSGNFDSTWVRNTHYPKQASFWIPVFTGRVDGPC